jgi:hypothetical protein
VSTHDLDVIARAYRALRMVDSADPTRPLADSTANAVNGAIGEIERLVRSRAGLRPSQLADIAEEIAQ